MDGAVDDLLAATAAAVLVVSPAGTVVYANHVCEAVFGSPVAQLTGRPLDRLLADGHDTVRSFLATHASQRPASRDVAGRPATDGPGEHGATGVRLDAGQGVRGLHHDGTSFPADVSLTPWRGRTEVRTVVSIVDATSRIEALERADNLGRAFEFLAGLNDAIVRAADEADLYERVCRLAVARGDYVAAFVLERTEDPGEGATITGFRQAATLPRRLAYEASPELIDIAAWDWLRIQTDDLFGPGLAADGQGDSPMTALLDATRAATFVGVPIVADGRAVAALVLLSGASTATNRRADVLRTAGRNLSSALDGFVARRQVQFLAAERDRLLRRVVDTQDRERAKIAADVHDDSIQSLAAVDLRLSLLERRLRASAEDLLPVAVDARAAVSTATDRLRRLLFDLDSSGGSGTLGDDLRDMAAYVFEDAEVGWAVTVPDGCRWPASTHVQAMRIVREALINTRKHAHARSVRIAAEPADGGITLSVIDDGVGIGDGDLTSAPGHRGLTTMRDRAAMIGGRCLLRAGEPNGTVMELWLPLESEDQTEPGDPLNPGDTRDLRPGLPVHRRKL
ncbi:ATP-binding protein [Spongisporangium articulatum]|uniref:histidine kinase n=1 Tax=Spongisporangium articulatum TaxID=3362603 RepID=A0ABW8AL11_9ACTN